jgi:hypothetical protein
MISRGNISEMKSICRPLYFLPLMSVSLPDAQFDPIAHISMFRSQPLGSPEKVTATLPQTLYHPARHPQPHQVQLLRYQLHLSFQFDRRKVMSRQPEHKLDLQKNRLVPGLVHSCNSSLYNALHRFEMKYWNINTAQSH